MNWGVVPRTQYEIACWRDGALAWEERFTNLVTTAGKNKFLDAMFVSGQALPVWCVGLVNGASYTAYAAADTMASHAGWLESADYGQPTRPVCTLGTIAAGAVSNTLAKAVFTMNATATVRGAFLVNQSTIGGTTGTLYGVGDFSVVRSVILGDTLNVTVTLSV